MNIALGKEYESPNAEIEYGRLVPGDRVHSSVYTDEVIFHQELERIWYRTWVYVAHESEISVAGSYVTRTIGLQPVIVSRDENAAIHILLNRCPHRGNMVCHYDSGHTNAFRCAYHGWSFRNDGELIGATFAAGFGPEFVRDSFNMAHVPRVDSYRGFIFASFAADGPSLTDHLGEAGECLDRFVDLSPAGVVDFTAGRILTTFSANWKMQMENMMDGYHPLFLHRSTLSQIKREDVPLEQIWNDVSNSRKVNLGHGHAMGDRREENRRHVGGGVDQFMGCITGGDVEPYTEELAKRVGEIRAKELVAEGLGSLTVYPNLSFIGYDVRAIQPLAPDRSLLVQSPALAVGEDDAIRRINRRRIAFVTGAYGAGGSVGPDDIEVFERSQRAMAAHSPEWMLLTRGLHREQIDDEGRIVGQLSDDTGIRAFWSQYQKDMTSST